MGGRTGVQVLLRVRPMLHAELQQDSAVAVTETVSLCLHMDMSMLGPDDTSHVANMPTFLRACSKLVCHTGWCDSLQARVGKEFQTVQPRL
jgi:hypothetical protein